MTAREESDEQLVDDLVLADNRLADLGSHPAVGGRKLIDGLATGRLGDYGRVGHGLAEGVREEGSGIVRRG